MWCSVGVWGCGAHAYGWDVSNRKGFQRCRRAPVFCPSFCSQNPKELKLLSLRQAAARSARRPSRRAVPNFIQKNSQESWCIHCGYVSTFAFSKSQLSKGRRTRRCRSCIEDEQRPSVDKLEVNRLKKLQMQVASPQAQLRSLARKVERLPSRAAGIEVMELNR